MKRARPRLEREANDRLRIALRKWICVQQHKQKEIAKTLKITDVLLSQWLSGNESIYADKAQEIQTLIGDNNATETRLKTY